MYSTRTHDKTVQLSAAGEHVIDPLTSELCILTFKRLHYSTGTDLQSKPVRAS